MNLDVKIRVRGRKLYIVYYYDNKRCVKSTGMTNTKINIKLINEELKPKIIRDLLDNKEPRMFVQTNYQDTIYYYLDKVLERTKNQKYATQKSYKSVIDNFKSVFLNKEIKKFTSQDMQSYVDLISKDLSKGSIIFYLAPINKAFTLAIKDDVIVKKPSYSIEKKSDKKQKSIFTVSQIKEMLHNSKGFVKTYLYISLYTGFRCSEIIGLKWSDIDFDKNTINVQRAIYEGVIDLPKSNKTFIVPLNQLLKDYLLTIDNNNDFIVNYENKNIFGSSFINKNLKLLQKELKYTNILTSHSLRHTFVSLMLSSGESKTLVKQFTGHSNMIMIDNIYTHHIHNDNDLSSYSKLLQ